MVGLFNKDSRIHYVDKDYVVIDNPTDNFTPTIVHREKGDPDFGRVRTIAILLGMTLDGEPFLRSDGLWCNKLKLNGAKNGK